MQLINRDRRIVTIVEDLAILQDIVEVGELWAQKGGLSMRTIVITETI